MAGAQAQQTLFGVRLAGELEAFLWDINPWWQGRPMRPLPPFRRWLFEPALQRLKTRLAPVTVLRGPRQVGKTTLQEQMIDYLLRQENVHPVEIKYRQRVDGHRDTVGLRAFLEKAVYNAPFAILVTLTDEVAVTDPRIVALPLSSLLMMR